MHTEGIVSHMALKLLLVQCVVYHGRVFEDDVQKDVK